MTIFALWAYTDPPEDKEHLSLEAQSRSPEGDLMFASESPSYGCL